jgi:hypothetical protein
MRYSELSESGYAFKLVELPIANIPHGIQGGTDEQRAQWEADGKPKAPTLGMRIIGPGEDIGIDALAKAYAKTQGVEKYDDVDPICVKARMVYTLATACVDPESDPRAPLLFFGDTVEQAAATLRNDPKHVLTFDTVVYLHEVYSCWRDKINPQANTIADLQLQEVTFKAAESADFLSYFRPGMLLNYAHTLAVLCVNSPELTGIISTISSRAASELERKQQKPSAPAKSASRKSKAKSKPPVKARRR